MLFVVASGVCSMSDGPPKGENTSGILLLIDITRKLCLRGCDIKTIVR